MLDGLLGRGGFSSKCKSLIKPTKTRIEVLRRRAEAKQRFLKEDLVKLLSNGLDINAYGRTEEFLAGLNLLSCYNFIEQACEYIYKQLSIMQKESGCPEECREPVASLMFAAARFSDLPELRDLRDVFQERYGNSLEYFANQVFVEKLASKPPTMEKKLQLLQDLALENSVKWDSKGFKQRMANPSVIAQDKPAKHDPPAMTDGKNKFLNIKDATSQADKGYVRSKERIEQASDGPILDNGRGNTVFRREELGIPVIRKQEIAGSSTPRPGTVKAETLLKGEDHDIPFSGRGDFIAAKHGSSRRKDDSFQKMETSGSSSHSRRPEYVAHVRMNADQQRENHDRVSPRISEVAASSSARLPVNSYGKGATNDHQIPQNIKRSTGKVQEEEAVKSSYNNVLPPPYVKPKDNSIPPPYIKPSGAHDRPKHARLDFDGSSLDPSPRIRAKPAVSPDHPYFKNDITEKDRDPQSHGARKGSKHLGFGSDGSSVSPSPRMKDRILREPDNSYYEELDHGKYRSDHNYIPLPKPRSIRRKHSKSSSSHDDVGSSEDARVVKRVSSSKRKEKKGLQILFDDDHYKKDEEEKMMDKLLLHYSKKPTGYDVEKLRKKPQSSHGDELMYPPNRSRSLPHEQTGESDMPKVVARANSFQPDNQAKHVHPKLPDYDDLAARFAALKGR